MTDTRPGMLVTLRNLSHGVNGFEHTVEREHDTAAYHLSTSCLRGEPCTRFLDVLGYEILGTLVHEELHHVFGRIEEEQANDRLDFVVSTSVDTIDWLGLDWVEIAE